jgi:hypothetical protein
LKHNGWPKVHSNTPFIFETRPTSIGRERIGKENLNLFTLSLLIGFLLSVNDLWYLNCSLCGLQKCDPIQRHAVNTLEASIPSLSWLIIF